MATFKACVRMPRNDGLYSVFIRVTHNRVARYIATNKTIDKGKLRKGEIRDPAILSYCSTLIRQYAERLNAVDISSWDINEVIRYLTNIDEDISFSKYAMRYIFRMADDWGMKRNSKNYNWALLSLQKYLGKSDVMFSDLTTKAIQNRVCSNLMLTTDGLQDRVEVMSLGELYQSALRLFHCYDPAKDVDLFNTLGTMRVTESEFCQLVGRMRLYQALTPERQRALPKMLLGDSQINAACRAFVSDSNFRCTGGTITGWQLLNLLNGAAKSSYIDGFLERNVNCTEFVQGIHRAKQGDDKYAWFLG